MSDNRNTSNSRVARHKVTAKPISKKHQPVFLRFLKWLLLLMVVFLVAGIGVFAYYAKDTPQLSQGDLQSPNATILYDDKGKPFKTIGGESRTYVKSNQIPQTLKDAVVSIEDRRFYKEKFGIDPIRIASAAVANVTGRSPLGLQGGSTLTQQLIKLSKFSTKTSDQTFKRKAQEAWLAVQVERQYSKDQILEYYMNKVYLNNGVNGMGTAAKYYFGKSLKTLDLPQLALIAGMPQSPSNYDPYRHPDLAKKRRDLVLDALLRNNKISATEATEAKQVPINTGLVNQQAVANNSTDSKATDAYVKEVLADLKQKGYDPYTSGLKVYTNINMDAQRKLYNIVNNDPSIPFPDDQLQTAVSITDPNNGHIVAMIGGRKTGAVQLGYNRAVQSGRSNGSSMKPLMDYGPAIEYLDYSTAHKLQDVPYTYPGTNIQLHDFDGRYLGTITARNALANSRNVPAIELLEAVGMTKAREFVKGLGITVPDDAGLSYGIGGNVSTVDEAAAYGAFANGGTYYAPTYIHKIETTDGITHSYDTDGTQAMKSSTAYMVTDMLKDVIRNGSGTLAQIPGLHQAAKTGTTDYSSEEIAKSGLDASLAKDSWFAGYTKNYSITVWTGYDEPLKNGLTMAERNVAAYIYKAMMLYLAQNSTNSNWVMPSNVVAKNVAGVRELYIKGTTTIPSYSGRLSSSSSVLYSSSETPVSSSSEVSDASSSVVETPSESSSVPETSSSTPVESSQSQSESSSVAPPTPNSGTGNTEATTP
ncbi:transglycosylase domain-containing protein [Latilactobacillus graminis]|uniref:Penicillin-binding protein 1A n=2 Tax=Latilactobacillus graminis TaxID=60519 RepID=A0AA89L070_9LACO|nr:PBP1A family penicillin-binding protein [Latilactobacillus graminis]KRM22234.1 penicillin-binding protein 1A [Latilactobacillus graminis DSM 20719]QFP79590.1 PBP1A family penicillin-binding protein [Latilactobacillus graminis]